MSLREIIEQEIRAHGPIRFSRYMELCLYHSELGYYSRNAAQFGKAGDFFTSSDVHAVFGRLLARQFDEIWRALGRPNKLEILELGPGRGLFARDLLDWLEKKSPEFFQALTYTLQESSPALRTKLVENLAGHIKRGKTTIAAGPRSGDVERVQVHRTESKETPVIVFANEFFDALPVEIISTQGKLHLGFEGDRLIEVWLAPTADELEFLDRYSVHPEEGERVEVALVGQRWAKAIATAIGRGFLVIIDYGYTRSEQLAGRHRGTLMAYRQHSAGSNPYEAPGEQDLTAHVNFAAVAAAAQHAGMSPQKLITQSQFLMGIGERDQFADVFEECKVPQERAKVTLQLKHLISPAGMGETFHVLVASRDVEPKKVAALSGLRFA